MKFQMAENSLFAILLRKPWWMSAATAVVLVAIARFMLPPTWFPYAVPIALPFLVIAGITGWRSLQAPSAARVAATEAAVRTLGWPEFATAVEDAWRRDGWTVARIDDAGADFEVTQGWRRGLVAARRWKVARTGVEPLRELQAARERREAHDCTYVAIGQVSDQALAYARANRIRIVQAAELARTMPDLGRARGRTPAITPARRPGKQAE